MGQGKEQGPCSGDTPATIWRRPLSRPRSGLGLHTMPKALVQLSLARPFPPVWCPRGRDGCSIPKNKQHRPHTYSDVRIQTSGDALYPLSTWTGGLRKHRAWRHISPLISQMGKLRPRQGALSTGPVVCAWRQDLCL